MYLISKHVISLLNLSLLFFTCSSSSLEMVGKVEDWEKWPLEELEMQMSPSRWNPTKSPEEVINEYINDGIQGTNKAREGMQTELNLSYGSNESQKLDIYGIDLSEDSFIMVWMHGGYWQEGSKDIAGTMALNTYSVRVKNVVLGYTLAPDVKIGEIQKEVLNALKFLIEKYPKGRIILGGHSAGGHLAANILHQSDNSLFPEIYQKLYGLVLVSGVYDLRLLVPTYINNLLKMDMKEAEKLSPLRSSYINPNFFTNNLKILFIYGKYDSLEFKRQSTAYRNLLNNHTVSSESWVGEDDDHFTVVQNMAHGSIEGSSGKIFKEFLINIAKQ